MKNLTISITVLLALLMSSLGFSQVKKSELCFSSPYDLFKKHPNVFERAKFAAVRQEGANENVLALRITKSLSSSNQLSKNGYDVGDRIFEICGNSMQNLFNASKEAPVCCSDGYPFKISVVGSNSSSAKHKSNVSP